ncbi:MAG: ribonuclease P protein component [Rhizobiaceae bacterium]|jgi:ribonuclease P protein component|nr:ribonuclease P protein component [Rhizobiaceae bacterium]
MVEKLRKRADFLKTQNGTRLRGPFFLLSTAENGLEFARVGFTVTKKQGNAVKRNRIRRRLKAQVRAHAGSLPGGRDYVITGSADVLNAKAATLTAEFERRFAAAGRPGLPQARRDAPADQRRTQDNPRPAPLTSDRTDNGQ